MHTTCSYEVRWRGRMVLAWQVWQPSKHACRRDHYQASAKIPTNLGGLLVQSFSGADKSEWGVCCSNRACSKVNDDSDSSPIGQSAITLPKEIMHAEIEDMYVHCILQEASIVDWQISPSIREICVQCCAVTWSCFPRPMNSEGPAQRRKCLTACYKMYIVNELYILTGVLHML